MDVAHPTAGWEQVGERFYRKTQLYSKIFDQSLDLDNYIVAGAPYGGAIGKRSVLMMRGSFTQVMNHGSLFTTSPTPCPILISVIPCA
jgi:hypothetical protein